VEIYLKMKDKISNILYDHFGWQRKESIEKATDEILIEMLAKDKLIEKQKELIKFYGERLADNAMFLHIHHMAETPENCAKGEKLRAEIAELEKQAETESIHERIKPYISDEEAVVSKWKREDKEKQAEEQENNEMYLNMQYYMEYCQSKGYVTPQEWIKNHKHF
jgi:hypothetical protein